MEIKGNVENLEHLGEGHTNLGEAHASVCFVIPPAITLRRGKETNDRKFTKKSHKMSLPPSRSPQHLYSGGFPCVPFYSMWIRLYHLDGFHV